MSNTRTAKLFRNGASPAVRLPADFRFEGDEVFATRDELTGDVTLSTRPGMNAWKDLFDLLHKVSGSEDFLSERPLNVIAPTKGIFDDEAGGSSR